MLPTGKATAPFLTESRSGHLMSLDMKVLVNDLECRQEALRRPTRLEALHNAFSFPYPPMRILDYIVEALVLTMIDAGQDAAFCRWVTAQPVGDQYAWHILTTHQQLTEEADHSLPIATPVNNDVEDLSVLVNCPVQILHFAVDFDEDLVHMPRVSWSWAMSAELAGILMPKLQTPIADRFIADNDPSLRQDRFDITVTQIKIEVEPNRIGNDFLGIAMTLVGRLMMGICHPNSINCCT